MTVIYYRVNIASGNHLSCARHATWEPGERTAEGSAATVISTLDTWFGTADFYLGNAVGEKIRRDQL
jgi:hypothetical protein